MCVLGSAKIMSGMRVDRCLPCPTLPNKLESVYGSSISEGTPLHVATTGKEEKEGKTDTSIVETAGGIIEQSKQREDCRLRFPWSIIFFSNHTPTATDRQYSRKVSSFSVSHTHAFRPSLCRNEPILRPSSYIEPPFPPPMLHGARKSQRILSLRVPGVSTPRSRSMTVVNVD